MDEIHAPSSNDDRWPQPRTIGGESGFLAEGLSFGALLDAAPDAMVIVDASGTIQFANRQTEAVFGFARQNLIGRPIEVLVPERYRRQHEQHRARFFANPRLRPLYAVSGLYGLRKDGHEFPVEISLSPIVGPSGLVVACAIRDVTDRVRSEELLRQRQEELAHVARLATVGELATGLAHELNQPLYSISNYAQGCLHRVRAASLQPEQLSEVLEEIAAEADRAAQLIRRLRRMVQKREPVRSSIDLNQAIEEACRLSQHDLKQHAVRLVQDLDRSLPRILADEIQVQQVVINLLRNAVEAMRESAPDRRVVVLSTTRHTPTAAGVHVRDFGCGIAEASQEQVFDAFYTTSSTGMGMGLTISRSIVASHGGTIWVTPNSDGGVTFHFTLPLPAKEAHGD